MISLERQLSPIQEVLGVVHRANITPQSPINEASGEAQKSGNDQRSSVLSRTVDRLKHVSHPEKEPGNEPLSPSIIFAYDGNFSGQIQLDEVMVQKFLEVSHLHTQIGVGRGNNVTRSDSMQMGDTLILRRFADPREVFKRIATDEAVDVDMDLRTQRAAIVIHDQVINQRILARNNNRMDGVLFTKEMNKALKSGLRQVAVKEKLFQAAFSGLNDIFLGFSAGLLGCDVPLLRDMFSRALHPGELEFLLSLGETFGAYIIFSFAKLSYQFLRLSENTNIENKDAYNITLNERFNPLQHVLDAQKGNLFLATVGRQLLKYTPTEK